METESADFRKLEVKAERLHVKSEAVAEAVIKLNTIFHRALICARGDHCITAYEGPWGERTLCKKFNLKSVTSLHPISTHPLFAL